MARLVTGASGFIGSALINQWLRQDEALQIYGYTRNPARLKAQFNGRVMPVTDLKSLDKTLQFDVVVNLAGEPILDRRWTANRKALLYDSRINTTTELLGLLKRLEQKPQLLISGSAVGYYGNQRDDLELTEKAEAHPGFAHQLCHDWENVALKAEGIPLRVCLMRTGVVIGPGGALAKMLPAFKLGLGGPIASGEQWMSWIDLADMVAAIDFLITHKTLQGVFNLTAPRPVTNREFSRQLGQQLNRPAWLPMPALILQMLLGEGAELLVEGQRVVPDRLIEAGFEFDYPTLESSLAHWLEA